MIFHPGFFTIFSALMVIRQFSIWVLLFAGIHCAFSPAAPNYRWSVLKSSHLRVFGTTNVNKFNCDISEYAALDTISCNKSKQKDGYTMAGGLQLDVKSFNCHNPIMTSDLRKTLKSKDYPYLYVRFINIAKLPDLKPSAETIGGWVEIEIAGVVKRFDMQYTISSANADQVVLSGKRQMLFSDFNITPPSRLGGMIRVNNELEVSFTLQMRPV
jgi:hypothetical protein